jgi:glyoxylase-like metal-dependent hydrolase (beta-lactamase superfamily II)/rhodanese-related sulfurtransferase
MSDDTMDLELVLTPGLGNTTYLIASGGEAVVVDPPRDAWRVTAVSAARRWRLTKVIETHVHNDYLSGALELRASDRVEIVAPARGGYRFAHRGVDHGDTVRVGDLQLVARATPGHTPEHLAWDVLPDGSTVPTAVLTGGSLMVGSAGRTDLLGAARTDALTVDQFRSLRGLAALPDDVAVLPTHGAGSFCAAGPIDAARTSTIGVERRHNPLFGAPDEATFRMTMLAGLAPYPAYYAHMAPLNRAGPAVLGRLPTPPALTPAEVRSAVAAGGHVVDGRSRRAFAAGHVPGALGVELDDSFASYVGWLVPFAAPVVLVLPEPGAEALAEATAQLVRIGYDRIVGWLDGGVERWADDGGPLDQYAVTTARALRAELADGPVGQLLDVRDPHEWRDDGRVPGALEIPLGELPARLAEVPGDGPITVMCKSGARASIAASLLDAAGRDVRLVGIGGAPDL